MDVQPYSLLGYIFYDCRHGSRPFVRYERLLLEIGRLVDGVKASVSCRGSSFSLDTDCVGRQPSKRKLHVEMTVASLKDCL
ncbi:hypothetical protein OUZ56_022518 [Daphnia magna]|uniref:Uncharacterized protein n=1 Tax=Daphnia magna TaxID=35525 RepID=A0ABR0AXC1_9CRUS|nr:hypothetical protein OUZ56_022518 [Daphnia magna]